MTCVSLYRKKSQRSKRLQNLLHSCNQPLAWGGLAMVIGRCSWIQFGAHDIISTIGLEKLYIYIYTYIHQYMHVHVHVYIFVYVYVYCICLCMHILYIQYYTVYIQYYCYYYTVYICTPIYIYMYVYNITAHIGTTGL